MAISSKTHLKIGTITGIVNLAQLGRVGSSLKQLNGSQRKEIELAQENNKLNKLMAVLNGQTLEANLESNKLAELNIKLQEAERKRIRIKEDEEKLSQAILNEKKDAIFNAKSDAETIAGSEQHIVEKLFAIDALNAVLNNHQITSQDFSSFEDKEYADETFKFLASTLDKINEELTDEQTEDINTIADILAVDEEEQIENLKKEAKDIEIQIEIESNNLKHIYLKEKKELEERLQVMVIEKPSEEIDEKVDEKVDEKWYHPDEELESNEISLRQLVELGLLYRKNKKGMFGKLNKKDFQKDVTSLDWTKDKKLFDGTNYIDMKLMPDLISSRLKKIKSIDEVDNETLKKVEKAAMETGFTGAGKILKKYGLTYVRNTTKELGNEEKKLGNEDAKVDDVKQTHAQARKNIISDQYKYETWRKLTKKEKDALTRKVDTRRIIAEAQSSGYEDPKTGKKIPYKFKDIGGETIGYHNHVRWHKTDEGKYIDSLSEEEARELWKERDINLGQGDYDREKTQEDLDSVTEEIESQQKLIETLKSSLKNLDLDNRIERHEKKIEEEKQAIAPLEKKYPFIRKIVTNR